MERELRKDFRIKKSLRNQTFLDTTFDGLEVCSRKMIDCKFHNVHFKHSQLGNNTTYSNCKFTNCKIEGKYSTLGNPATYINCSFEDFNFKGNMIFMGAIFEHCQFSGSFSNNIFINEKRWFKKYSTFNNCDLSDVNFENITFNSVRTFKECKLPEKGIRLFRNDNNDLLNFINSRQDSELTNSIRILFDSQLKQDQNPLIFDEVTLNTFLQSSELQLFKQLTSDYEQ